ncbi:MAG TPA: serine hydrolase domain-containing protein [Candidatus Acidoferrum sp.]|nr:serine hydrolase domain-containing protein [Candidatus Acidoferrum sp.]
MSRSPRPWPFSRLWPLLWLVAGAACGASQAPPASGDALAGRIDAVIDRAIAEQRVVGTVVLVARDGEVVYRRAAGLADREAKRPMREDSIVLFSSVTKPIVSAAALALVEAGRLRLDDPVTRWLPDFKPRLPDGREPTITVRQLLTHTAGLNYPFFEKEDGPYHRAEVSNGFDQPGLSFEENAARIASVPLLYEPGTGWGYSLATDVLGEVVARAGGGTLPEVVKRTVTGPLALRDTGFTIADPQRLATPYADARPRPVRMSDDHLLAFGASALRYAPARIFDPASYPSGGAGMAGTAGDFLRFLETLRKGGAPILKPETLREMTRNQVGHMAESGIGPGWGFGYGVSVLEDPAAAKVPMSPGTWRWGGVYGHTWWVDPAQRLSVVVFTNTGIEGMIGAFPTDIARAVYAR